MCKPGSVNMWLLLTAIKKGRQKLFPSGGQAAEVMDCNVVMNFLPL